MVSMMNRKKVSEVPKLSWEERVGLLRFDLALAQCEGKKKKKEKENNLGLLTVLFMIISDNLETFTPYRCCGSTVQQEQVLLNAR